MRIPYLFLIPMALTLGLGLLASSVAGPADVGDPSPYELQYAGPYEGVTRGMDCMVLSGMQSGLHVLLGFQNSSLQANGMPVLPPEMASYRSRLFENFRKEWMGRMASVQNSQLKRGLSELLQDSSLSFASFYTEFEVWYKNVCPAAFDLDYFLGCIFGAYPSEDRPSEDHPCKRGAVGGSPLLVLKDWP